MTTGRFHLGSRALRLAAGLAATVCVSAMTAASASAQNAHGQLLHLLRPPATAAGINASQSTNWFGYDQGALQPGNSLFHSITGNWTVPKASQHKKHQAEYSSDWIGIGGGCEDNGCTVQDNTLIQTGTEQDVSASGKPSYSAWWEIIPSPATIIPRLKIHAGDHMHAALSQASPGVWKVVISDLSRHQTFTTTVPYSSSQGTAEWIEETPLILGSNAGFAPLPNLTRVRFDHATANGHSAKLKPSEEIKLTTSGGKVIGVPSAPDPTKDGFNSCAWSTTCPTPHSG